MSQSSGRLRYLRKLRDMVNANLHITKKKREPCVTQTYSKMSRSFARNKHLERDLWLFLADVKPDPRWRYGRRGLEGGKGSWFRILLFAGEVPPVSSVIYHLFKPSTNQHVTGGFSVTIRALSNKLSLLCAVLCLY
jgi:hypothetical protein